MGLGRKSVLNIYIFVLCVLFAAALYRNLGHISDGVWIAIITLAGIASLFDTRAIVLPSGEDLSLVSPLLFIAGVLYGILPVFLIVLIIALILALDKPNRWAIILFNSIQYGLSAWAGLRAYGMLGGATGSLQLENPASYVAFVLVYFVTNVLLVSAYLLIRGGVSAKQTIQIFLDRKSLLVYFTMISLGILMTKVIEINGLYGVIIFSIVLWGLGASYRNYYQMFEHFKSLSIKDELTGLYNHRFFQEKLQELVSKGEPLALLLLDLDHFKAYNDLYGHPQGDKLLQQVSGLVLGAVPEGGVSCRYGGEEFGVILPQTGTEDALGIAESIRSRVADFGFYGMEHMPNGNVTVSIGVSTYPDMANSKESLIELADEALYKVKFTTRNKVQIYSSVIDELKSSFHFGTEEVELIQTIKSLLAIINSKDLYTYGHTERNMGYAEALARNVGLPEEEVKYIRYGALLHDIGKVEVPTEILNKKSCLTEAESETIKMHVIWGERIVEPIKELAPCLPIIRHHHERYDGKGYPDGLKGDQIPLAARILTIADSFDAMTTNRPYQKTKSVPEALSEIQACSGCQFDPELVNKFMAMVLSGKQELHRRGA